MSTETQDNQYHPNGLKIISYKDPSRNEDVFLDRVLPRDPIGDLIHNILPLYALKTCQRTGWLKKGACSDPGLFPNESVASHAHAVSVLISIICEHPIFKEEVGQFDEGKAKDMALFHDTAEAIVGDITPTDGISAEDKHRMEHEASLRLYGHFEENIKNKLNRIYREYEQRVSIESKMVKDCDKLDFILQAFVNERLGFSGFDEFYPNSTKSGYSTKICAEMSKTLIETRNKLKESGKLYFEKQAVNH